MLLRTEPSFSARYVNSYLPTYLRVVSKLVSWSVSESDTSKVQSNLLYEKLALIIRWPFAWLLLLQGCCYYYN